MKKEFTGPRSHKGWETLVYTVRTAVVFTCLHIKCAVFLFYCNQICSFSTNVRKRTQCQISRISVQCEPSFYTWAGGWTWTQLTGSFFFCSCERAWKVYKAYYSGRRMLINSECSQCIRHRAVFTFVWFEAYAQQEHSCGCIGVVTHLAHSSRLEIQGVIRFLWAQEVSVGDIHLQLMEVYGNAVMSRQHVANSWRRTVAVDDEASRRQKQTV